MNFHKHIILFILDIVWQAHKINKLTICMHVLVNIVSVKAGTDCNAYDNLTVQKYADIILNAVNITQYYNLLWSDMRQ